VLLPRVECDADIDRLREDTETCLAAIRAVAQQEGLPAAQAVFFREGSALVGSAGSAVIKIFAPFDHEHRATEATVLADVAGRLSCPTPRPLGQGELEGWPYVVMSRLDGVLLSDVWSGLDPASRRRLCGDIGRVVADLHQLAPPSLAELPLQWAGFLAAQREGCVARQVSRGLADRWVVQIEGFLDEVRLTDAPPRLLHTELMREHFMVQEAGGSFSLSGLFDFEPAMLGHPEYDFASIGVFISRGEPGLLGALLRAYGWGGRLEGDAGRALQRRLMAYALLHRYSNLAWYLRVLGSGDAQTLEALAARWWSF